MQLPEGPRLFRHLSSKLSPRTLVRHTIYCSSCAAPAHFFFAAPVKHFDRDPYTNQLLWFSGAPIETPRIRQPKHSLDYLYFLARQQEKRHRGEDLDESKPKAALASAMSVELANLHHEIFGAGLAQDLPLASADRNGDVEMSS